MKKLNRQEAAYVYALAQKKVLKDCIDKMFNEYMNKRPDSIPENKWKNMFVNPLKEETLYGRLNNSNNANNFDKESFKKMDSYLQGIINYGFDKKVVNNYASVENLNNIIQPINDARNIDVALSIQFLMIRDKNFFLVDPSEIEKAAKDICKICGYDYGNIKFNGLQKDVNKLLKNNNMSISNPDLTNNSELQNLADIYYDVKKIDEMELDETLKYVDEENVKENNAINDIKNSIEDKSFSSISDKIDTMFHNAKDYLDSTDEEIAKDYINHNLRTLAALSDIHNSKSKPTFFGKIFKTKYYKDYTNEANKLEAKKQELIKNGIDKDTIDIYSSNKHNSMTVNNIGLEAIIEKVKTAFNEIEQEPQSVETETKYDLSEDEAKVFEEENEKLKGELPNKEEIEENKVDLNGPDFN